MTTPLDASRARACTTDSNDDTQMSLAHVDAATHAHPCAASATAGDASVESHHASVDRASTTAAGGTAVSDLRYSVAAASAGTPSAAAVSTATADTGAVATIEREGEERNGTLPPLRTGSVAADSVLNQQDQPQHEHEQQQMSPPSSQACEPLRTQAHSASLPCSPQSTELSTLDAAQDHSLAFSAGLFTPILIAAQPPPLDRMLSPSGTKRKRVEPRTDATSGAGCPRELDGNTPLTTTPRRKGSGDYLRKGQWTATEEKFARALIEAFEDGYLPIYTGIRLRGYLAVQLQCDPMRISKKLCGGSVDGRAVPKNYGQKKFKLRKKQSWDADAAARVLAHLEQLQRELWAESGLPRPPFLTLSSTRNAGDDAALRSSSGLAHAAVFASHQDDAASSSSSSSSERESSSRSHALPIIYLNLSKKTKTSAAVRPAATAAATTAVTLSQDVKVDGDSLQAAYELLKLFQAPTEAT